MTPLWVSLLEPLAELTATAFLATKLNSFKRYPALSVYLLTEALWHTLYAFPATLPIVRLAHPLRMLARAWVVTELFRLGGVELRDRKRTIVAAVALLACCGAAMLAAFTRHLDPFYTLMVFRQYFHAYLTLALLALELGMWPRIQIVSRERIAYRRGMLAWLTILAVSGMFAGAGLGYGVFPWNDSTYGIVTLATYASLTATVSAMAWGMGRRVRVRAAAERTATAWVRRAA